MPAFKKYVKTLTQKRLLLLLAGVFLSAVLVFGVMSGQASPAWEFLANTYHGLERSIWKIRATFDSFNYGAGTSKPATQVRVSEVDGMTMLYIPAGEFTMGSDEYTPKTAPAHRVHLDSYWIDQTEVANEMYARCVEAGVCARPIQSEDMNPYYDNPEYDNYPVVYVSWSSAAGYCEWAGRRLPTEAEWEKAARGPDGNPYPWGNEEPGSRLLNYQDNIGGPLPVDRYPLGASPYGALNMAGNVREWVQDWFSPTYYEKWWFYTNPAGPEGGTRKTLRGGGFRDTAQRVPTYNRFAHNPASPGIDRGFRCAMDAEE
jgi:formylglycine-generating enzyme required for sulfatase activity